MARLVLCPVCDQPQVIVEFEGIELDVCADGHGTWFDGQELRLLFAAIEVPEALRDLEQRLTRIEGVGPKRRCPRCRRKMHHVQAPARPAPVTIDRCPNGHGVWFDPGELEQIVAAEPGSGSDALDRIRRHLSAFDRAAPARPAPPQET